MCDFLSWSISFVYSLSRPQCLITEKALFLIQVESRIIIKATAELVDSTSLDIANRVNKNYSH